MHVPILPVQKSVPFSSSDSRYSRRKMLQFYRYKSNKKTKKKKVISVQSCRDVKGIPDQTLPMVLLVVLTLLD